MAKFIFDFSFGTLNNQNQPVTLPFCIDTDGEEIARAAHEEFKACMWESFNLSRSGSEKDVSVSWRTLPDGVFNEIWLDPKIKDVIDVFAFDFSKIDMYKISDLTIEN